MFQSLKSLRSTFAHDGQVQWLGVRVARDQPIQTKASVRITTAGIIGDRFNAKRIDVRTVTLIQHEHLAVMASLLDMGELDPALTRRNIVVSGINLLALKGLVFELGGAVLETTGLCHPCSKMERTLGAGAHNAMRGHGGITARVLQAGEVSVGDSVVPRVVV
jgi:MOSC domain-containing protein YiiM